MSAFDKVIGYDDVKRELLRLCDMLVDRERYERLGAAMPRGLLIHGGPGLGKTLMARCFMEELGWTSFTVRRSRGDGDFLRELERVFREAAEKAPSVILLDDMDKFAAEERSQEEYAAVQAGIDAVAEREVYVVATANNLRNVPKSLLRAGRFDTKIKVDAPKDGEGEQIISHYLRSKSLGDSVRVSDVAKMLWGKSCAELESALNQAAIYAGYARSEKVEMEHIVEAVLCDEYQARGSEAEPDTRKRWYIAYHEAGHAVMQDLLCEGSVGLVSVRPQSIGLGGFTRRCVEWSAEAYSYGSSLVSLAGPAATELKYGVRHIGSCSDLRYAARMVRGDVEDQGIYGLGLLDQRSEHSNDVLARQEQAVGVELERAMTTARRILADNRGYLDAVAAELMAKDTLLNSDVKRIRAACAITPVSLMIA